MASQLCNFYVPGKPSKNKIGNMNPARPQLGGFLLLKDRLKLKERERKAEGKQDQLAHVTASWVGKLKES